MGSAVDSPLAGGEGGGMCSPPPLFRCRRRRSPLSFPPCFGRRRRRSPLAPKTRSISEYKISRLRHTMYNFYYFFASAARNSLFLCTFYGQHVFLKLLNFLHRIFQRYLFPFLLLAQPQNSQLATLRAEFYNMGVVDSAMVVAELSSLRALPSFLLPWPR